MNTMRLPLLALAGLCISACQPESDKTNPAVAMLESVAVREATAPATGANSFTEEQARDRIIAAGYSDVSGLALGEDGVWRGSAMVTGQTQDVALDYQGNVTAGANPAPGMGTPVAPPSTSPAPLSTPPADSSTPPEPRP
jgi:hypothetical protein